MGDEKPRILLPRALRSPEELAATAPKPGPPPPVRPFPWKFAIFVVALAGAGLLLARKMADDAALQDCVQAGHKNCVKLDPALGR